MPCKVVVFLVWVSGLGIITVVLLSSASKIPRYKPNFLLCSFLNWLGFSPFILAGVSYFLAALPLLFRFGAVSNKGCCSEMYTPNLSPGLSSSFTRPCDLTGNPRILCISLTTASNLLYFPQCYQVPSNSQVGITPTPSQGATGAAMSNQCKSSQLRKAPWGIWVSAWLTCVLFQPFYLCFYLRQEIEDACHSLYLFFSKVTVLPAPYLLMLHTILYFLEVPSSIFVA